MKIYGIKSCSSVKKALAYLDTKGFEYEFKDIKKLDEPTLDAWLTQASLEKLINTAGATAKKLGLNKEKLASFDKAGLKKLILAHPSLIKRPVIEAFEALYIGKEYEGLEKR